MARVSMEMVKVRTHGGYLYELSGALRPIDLEELRLLSEPGVADWELLYQCVEDSTETFLVYQHEEHSRERHRRPVAIFGVTTEGVAWLLASRYIRGDASRFLLRIAPTVLHGWWGRFGDLWNFVDNRNTLHLRWCRAVGFALTPHSDPPYTHIHWEPPHV